MYIIYTISVCGSGCNGVGGGGLQGLDPLIINSRLLHITNQADALYLCR